MFLDVWPTPVLRFRRHRVSIREPLPPHTRHFTAAGGTGGGSDPRADSFPLALPNSRRACSEFAFGADALALKAVVTERSDRIAYCALINATREPPSSSVSTRERKRGELRLRALPALDSSLVVDRLRPVTVVTSPSLFGGGPRSSRGGFLAGWQCLPGFLHARIFVCQPRKKRAS